MQTLINFFTLGPTFSFFGVQIVWYVYLANTIIQTYTSLSNISQILAQRHLHLVLSSPNSLLLLLGLIAQLLIVRLLIEVAAIIISERTSKARDVHAG
jgi:hypothetical protein